MFLDEYEKYYDHYKPGIKKISVRSTYPKIDRKKIELQMAKSHGNYDLVFNQKGVLLHSVHLEKNKNFKIFYGYNRNGKLVSAFQLMSNTNELLEISEFSYDESGRILKEMCRSFEYNSYPPVISEYNHSYNGAVKETLITLDDYDDDYIIYSTFNGQNNLVEEKAIRGEDELVYWSKYEYAADETLVREISLDSNGNQDGLYEFLYPDNEVSTGYKYTSAKESYLREVSFEYNEKGHWVSQILITDGEPKYLYDRAIEYY